MAKKKAAPTAEKNLGPLQNSFTTTILFKNETDAILKFSAILKWRGGERLYYGGNSNHPVPSTVLCTSDDFSHPSPLAVSRFGLGLVAVAPVAGNPNSVIPLFRSRAGDAEFEVPRHIFFVSPKLTGGAAKFVRDAVYLDPGNAKCDPPICVGKQAHGLATQYVVLYPKLGKPDETLDKILAAKPKTGKAGERENKAQGPAETLASLAGELLSAWQRLHASDTEVAAKSERVREALEGAYDWCGAFDDKDALEIREIYEKKQGREVEKIEAMQSVEPEEEIEAMREKIERAKGAIDSLTEYIGSVGGNRRERAEIAGKLAVLEEHAWRLAIDAAGKNESKMAQFGWKAMLGAQALRVYLTGRENEYEGELELNVTHIVSFVADPFATILTSVAPEGSNAIDGRADY